MRVQYKADLPLQTNNQTTVLYKLVIIIGMSKERSKVGWFLTNLFQNIALFGIKTQNFKHTSKI
jgi:hypothetical protein